MSTTEWREVSVGPWSKRRKHQAVVWQDKILLLGGFDGEAAFDLNDVWSWDGSNWTLVCEHAGWSGRDGHCAVVLNDAIYILGGTDDPYNCRCDVWRSEDGGSNWRQMCAYAKWPERWQHAACVHNGKMYVIGGWGDKYLNDVWSSSDGLNWELVCAHAPWKARMFLSAISFNDAIYIIGGHDGKVQLRDVWASSDDGVSWTQVCQVAQWDGRQGHACLLLDGFVYLMGGFGGSSRFNDLWKSADCAHWTLVSRYCTWTPRQGHAVTSLNGAIYLLGGFDETGYCNNMYSLDVSQSDAAASRGSNNGGAATSTQRRSPKTITVSLSTTLESISNLRAKRAERARLLQAIADMLQLVKTASSFEAGGGDAVEDQEGVGGAGFEGALGAIMVEAKPASQLKSPQQSTSPLFPPSPPQVLDEQSFDVDPRSAFVQNLVTRAADVAASPNSGSIGKPSPKTMAEDRAFLKDLQKKIRNASESGDVDEVAKLIEQRTAFAARASEHANQLMQYTLNVRRSQDLKQKHLSRMLTRIESFHLLGINGQGNYFLESDSKDSNDGAGNLLPDEGSQCTLAEWEDIVQSFESALRAMDHSSADAAILALKEEMLDQARVARDIADWMCDAPASTDLSSPNTGEDGSSLAIATGGGAGGSGIPLRASFSGSLPSIALSSSLSSSSRPTSEEKTSAPTLFFPISSSMSASRRRHNNYEQLCNEYQDVDEELERKRMMVKTAVDREISEMVDIESSTRSILRKSMEKGCGFVKYMITENSMESMNFSELEAEVRAWTETATCLSQKDEIKERCKILVKVNDSKAEALLDLENERIDKRSALEKAALKSGRSKNMTARSNSKSPIPSNPLSASSTSSSASILSSLSMDESSSEMSDLKSALFAAEKAVKDARRDLRHWYRQVRKIAIDLAPELFHLLPDLQAPGSVLGDGGFAENAKLPHRRLDEYEEIGYLHDAAAGAGVDAKSGGAGGRHVLLKAKYDGEDVVLKGFIMHEGEQRKGMERELSILSRLRNDSIICPAAIVESSGVLDSLLDTPALQVGVYIEYPFCKGGNLSGWLKSERKPWELQGVARQLLYGLMYLHDHGVIHKDIKPSNVLLHEDGRVVLADFELSREIKSSEDMDEISTTSRSGTRGFMSPEVEADGHAVFASDMYSFGVLLYFMHFPSHVSNLVPGDPRIPANNDAELTDLIQRLLSISPTARPTAASALMHPYFRSTFVERLMQDGEVVEQDRKLEAVRNLLHRARSDNRTNLEKLTLNREQLVEKVLDYFQNMSLERMRALLRVTFIGEPGIDEGGLLTEMFTLFFDSIFQGECGIFEGSDSALKSSDSSDNVSSPNRDESSSSSGSGSESVRKARRDNEAKVVNSVVLPSASDQSPARMQRLRAFGRAMVKALYEGRRIGSRLCPSVFKFITGAGPNMRDLQMFDPQTARSLQWTLATAGVEEFSLHFESVGAPELGPVTDANKTNFVKLKIERIMVGSRLPHLLAIKAGFIEALKALSEEAAPFMSLLSHTDWRVMLCGDPAISGPQVNAALRFSGFPKKSLVPTWLKDIILSSSEDHLRKLLVFCTGSPSLSSATSSTGKLEINVRCQARSGALPVAHTCFFHLDVPDYKEKEILQAKLLYAITNAQSFEVV